MNIFFKKRIFVLSCAAAILIFIVSRAAFIHFRPLPHQPKLNIILITVDALRYDHLGCYGYKRNTSPNIDKLAKEGIVLTQAISQGSFTAPSLPSIMTARYPNRHGVKAWGDSIDKSLATLAQILKKNGFSTASICASDVFASILGLDKGFDSLSRHDDNLVAGEVTHRAIRWLKDNRSKNFFLWLHYLEPHEPYRPPLRTKKEFTANIIDKGKQAKLVPILAKDPSDRDVYGAIGGIAKYAVVDGRRDMEFYVALYDAEIKYADEQIGIFLEKLKEMGLEENTLIILSADHGESLGDHNLYFTHGQFLYDELIRVPLIIKFKKLFPAYKTIDSQVRLIDVMPTILDIAGIRPSAKTDGVSLLPLISGKSSFPQLCAFSDFDVKKSIRTPEWKLICTDPYGGEYELYNLKDDPKESVNLAKGNLTAEERIQFRFLKQKLNDYSKQELSISVKPIRVLSERARNKLKSLGYLQ